jgi:RNA polymerase sigma factor (sigma-70 family)
MPPPSSATLFRRFCRLASPLAPDTELLGRWVRQRDEDAFAALVARHGGMVLGVCRRVLGNGPDAEDAFQAAFLVLARKAASLRRPEAVGGWLHGVAVRLARKARRAADRRRVPGLAAGPEPSDPHPDPLDRLSARELLALIDEEVAALPEVYRLALVLCDLEERTQPEAARLLGWSPGSLRGRLLRGRALLRQRLRRRGVALASVGCVLTAGPAWEGARAAVLPALAAGVARSAVVFSACPTAAGVSPGAAALARQGLRGLAWTRFQLVAAVLLALGASAVGVGVLAGPSQPAEQGAPAESPASPEDAPDKLADKADVRRGQDGEPLPDEAVARLGTTHFRHGGLVQHLAFTPDGKALLSAGGGSLRVWDVATGREIRRFADEVKAQSVSVAPDGKTVAALIPLAPTADEPMVICDFASGKVLRRFGKRGLFANVLHSPDGRAVAVFGRANTIELWDPGTGQLLHMLKGHEDQVWSAAFTPDGKALVSAGDDKTIRFWDTATGKQTRQITHTSWVGKVALSPDGKLLATIDHTKKQSGIGTIWRPDHRVRVWDVATGQELRQLAMPAKEVSPGIEAGFFSLAFAPDGRTLVAGAIIDGTLRVWDAATGRELRQLTDFSGTVGPLAFSPDGKALAVAHGNTNLRVIDFASGKDLVETPGHRSWVGSAAVTAGGRTVVTAGGDVTLRSWDLATGRELRRRDLGAGSSVTWLLPGGKSYLTAERRDNTFRVHDVETGKEQPAFRGQDAYRWALSPDRKTFASADRDQAVRLIDTATGQRRHTLAGVDAAGMSFTPDGLRLVVWDRHRVVTVWDVPTGKQLRRFAAPTPDEGPWAAAAGPLPYAAALSPDGELFAIGFQSVSPGRAPPCVVLETASGKEVCRFAAAEDGVMRLEFSPDGKSLAWAGWTDGTVSLGEVATGGVRRRFVGHRGQVSCLAFSADGRTLVSGSGDTTALVWDLTGRLAAGEGKPLSDAALKTAWDALAEKDADAAYRAVQALAADPARSVPYLRERLPPVAPVEAKRLARLIAELDDDRFEVRDKAAAELEKLGGAALSALREALDGRPTPEARRRMEQLVEKQERERRSSSGEPLRARRALEVLERAGTPEARRALQALADGAPGAWLTQDAKAALSRLDDRP